jgi:hypothetical protein
MILPLLALVDILQEHFEHFSFDSPGWTSGHLLAIGNILEVVN